MNTATAIQTLFAEDHISCSSLGLFQRCPRKYRFRYIDQLPVETRASALAFGSAVHEALAGFYVALKAGEPELSADQLATVFRDAWRRELRSDTPILFGDNESADSLIDLGVRMLSVFHETAERPHRVVEVEMPFSIEIAEGLPLLVGVLDLVVQDKDELYGVIEHKTGAKRWTDEKLNYDGQLTAYRMAAPYLGLGDAPVTIQLLTKTKQPDLVIYNPTRTQADIDEFVETASAVLRAVEAGAFWCSRSWQCNGCEYAARCVAG